MTTEALRNRIVGSGEEAPGQLVANPNNWRIHPRTQQLALRGSLETVGWVQQVMVNRQTGHLVDGHARVEQALSRGESMVPVLYVDLDPEEEALVLATLDPIAAMAGKDDEKLRELLADLTVEDEGLAAMLAELSPSEKVGRGDPDEVPALRKTSHIQSGDVFALGRHRLMCGDATVTEDVAKLMGGDKAQMVATDPPYAIYGSSTGISTSIADDKMVRPFFESVLRVCAEYVEMFGHVYICCDWRSWPSWWEMAKRASLTPKNLIVWDKEVIGMGSSYANSYELVGFFALLPEQKVMTSNPTSGNQRQVHKSNVWRGPKVPGGQREHNAQKPVALMEFLLQNSSDKDGIVLEPFSGSGSTMIAAEQLGRRCYAMDIDPRYVAVAIERWEKFTGEKAAKVGWRTKQTDARVALILNVLRAGNTRRAAAAYAEVDSATFYRWLDADAAFREAVEKAEADAEVRYASQVARAATDGTWTAAAWWLERRRHESYARRELVQMTIDYKGEVQKLAQDLGLDPDEVMAEAEAVLRAGQ